MGQGHHGRMVARPEYYDVVPAIQPPPVHRAGPEMLQPSPISHAPIPFLNAYYTDTGAFQPRDDPVDGELAPSYYASTVSTTDYYHDSRDAPPPPTGMAQPWVEPVSEPYSVQTFQTPSELMAQLCASDDSRAGTGYSETIDTALRSTFSASPEAKDDSTTPEASETANTRPNSRVSQSSSSISILPDAPPANDHISSHEKKRHYLETLEQYVQYLRHQFQLLGATPVPLRRVDSYRGLNSRSIRTLLVHMENSNKKLAQKTVAEERRFLALRDEVLRQDALRIQGTRKQTDF